MQAVATEDPPVRPVVRIGRRRATTVRIALPSLVPAGGPDALALGALALFLTGFGLVMVLSASSVEAAAAGNPYGDFTTQAVAAFLGTGAMLVVATRLPTRVLLRVAPAAFAATVLLQVVTAKTPLGTVVGGNQNWIRVGSISVQPSEFVKLSLVLVLASFFSRRRGERLGLVGLLPAFGFSSVAIGSVYLGGDLGTCLILALIAAGAMLFGGVRVRALLVPAGVATAGLWLLAQQNGSRTGRLAAWQEGCTDLLSKHCWQSTQAQWALANGGVTGVGLGNSVSKWFWLPEADNDFIAAVIGEETGLVGLAVLVLCFVAVTVVLLRIARTEDRFSRTAAGMAIAWLVGQAFANLAVVVGLAPVFGVPLPFLSAGGSAMVAGLLLVGCVMALADRPITRPATGA